jgi:HEAT repeats
MRLKYFLGILGLGTICLLAVALISPSHPAASTDQAVAAASNEPASAEEAQRQEKVERAQAPSLPQDPSHAVALAPAGASTTGATDTGVDEAQHEAYVEARTAELRDLARKSDAASLGTLLSEVRNPDQEIRQAALDALSQSGNRNAIPGLQQAAAQTENPGEKQAIQEVIEFLKLPTLTETLRGQGAAQSR